MSAIAIPNKREKNNSWWPVIGQPEVEARLWGLQNMLDHTPREILNQLTTGWVVIPRGALLVVDDMPALCRDAFDQWQAYSDVLAGVTVSDYGNCLVAPLEKIEEQSTVVDLRWIKEQLDIGVSGLADLFGVTRKTVYDWLDGVEPKRGNRAAVISILKSALEAENLGASARFLDQVWSSPVYEGKSLQAMLSSETSLDSMKAALEKLKPLLREIESLSKKGSGNDFGRAHIEDLIRTL